MYSWAAGQAQSVLFGMSDWVLDVWLAVAIDSGSHKSGFGMRFQRKSAVSRQNPAAQQTSVYLWMCVSLCDHISVFICWWCVWLCICDFVVMVFMCVFSHLPECVCVTQALCSCMYAHHASTTLASRAHVLRATSWTPVTFSPVTRGWCHH